MVRKALTALVLGAGLLAVALAPACGGCHKKRKAHPTFAVFPRDSDLLLGIDGPALRQGRHYRDLKRMLPGEVAQAVASLKSCGIDPIEGVKAVTVSGSSKDRRLVARINGFTRLDFKQCGEVARELRIVDQGSTTAFTIRGKTSYMAWLDDETFLTGPGWKAEQLSDFGSGQGRLDTRDELMDMVDAVDTSAPLWVAWAPFEGKLEVPMVGTLLGVRGTLSLTGGLHLELAARMVTDQQASDAVSLAQAALPQFKEDAGDLAEFLPRIQVAASGSTVTVKVALDDAETTRLIHAIEANPTVRDTLRDIVPF